MSSVKHLDCKRVLPPILHECYEMPLVFVHVVAYCSYNLKCFLSVSHDYSPSTLALLTATRPVSVNQNHPYLAGLARAELEHFSYVHIFGNVLDYSLTIPSQCQDTDSPVHWQTAAQTV